MAEGGVIHRSLGAQVSGSVRLLDCLRLNSPSGPVLRLWFGRGVRAQQIALNGDDTVQIQPAVRAGQNLIAGGTCDAVEGPLALQFRDGAMTVTPSKVETHLFRGLNVFVALRHCETPETLTDWLRYHAERHGAQAALIVDRGQLDTDGEDFFGALSAVPGLQRICVLTSPLPMGRLDQAAISDPGDAPRVQKRTAKANPWHAPLEEPALYDILKWRFLARAAGVAILDVCDLLVEQDIDIFSAARQSLCGAVPITGEAVYPWRIRKGAAPGFADHICRADPPTVLLAQWAVDPSRCGPENLWLSGGVTGMAMSEGGGAFQRCQSLVFPLSPIKDLVDKTVLVEDPVLLARATAFFKGKPVRPPAEKAPAAPVEAVFMPSGRTVIVTCMKNEGPFILEWLAYHRMIGVDQVIVYTNDCTDGTDSLLDLLQARGLVQRRDNPYLVTGQRPQHAALAAAQDEPLVRDAGWILPIDVDEFVNIHVGSGRLADLHDAVPGMDAVSMTWRLFGNSDHVGFADSFVTRQFTRCAPHLIRRPHQAWGFKTLYRNSGVFGEMAVHRPKGTLSGAQVHWVNGSGRPMPRGILRSGWRSGIDSYGYDLVTLNHYSVRCAESFLVKRHRGRVNHVARDQGEAYWFRMNNNAEEDRSIQQHLPALKQAVAALKSDPEIAAAHGACVAAHKARIAALNSDPDYRSLFDSIASDRMQRLSRLHRHFGMNVFLNGPSVVPDSVLEPGLPPDFFFNIAPPSGPAAD